MLVLGAVWVLIGVGSAVGAPQHIDSAVHLLIPASVRVALWVVSGMVAVGTCWSSRASNVGLGGLVIMPMVRLVSYTWAWVQSLIPGDPDGYPDGWYSALFYVVMLALVWVVAAIPAHTTTPIIGTTIDPPESASDDRGL